MCPLLPKERASYEAVPSGTHEGSRRFGDEGAECMGGGGGGERPPSGVDSGISMGRGGGGGSSMRRKPEISPHFPPPARGGTQHG